MSSESDIGSEFFAQTTTEDQKLLKYTQTYVNEMGYTHETIIDPVTRIESHIFYDPTKCDTFVELKLGAEDAAPKQAKFYRKTQASIEERSQEIRAGEKAEHQGHREERKPTHKKKATDEYKALFYDDEDIDDDGPNDAYDPAIIEYEGPELRSVVEAAKLVVVKPGTLSPERPTHVRKISEFSGKSVDTLNDSAISSGGSSGSSEDGDDRRTSLPESPESTRKAPVKKSIGDDFGSDSGGEDFYFGIPLPDSLGGDDATELLGKGGDDAPTAVEAF